MKRYPNIKVDTHPHIATNSNVIPPLMSPEATVYVVYVCQLDVGLTEIFTT
jgi:hypothetical protein